jgi:hypothetical protein
MAEHKTQAADTGLSSGIADAKFGDVGGLPSGDLPITRIGVGGREPVRLHFSPTYRST